MSSHYSRHPELFAPSGCLTSEALSALAAGTLTKNELDAAGKHLLTCPLCSDAAEGMKLWINQVAEDNTSETSSSKQGKTINDGAHRTIRSYSTVKAAHLLHEQTSRINKRISTRLNNEMPVSGTRRLAYKPFVWLSVAATILLFFAVYFGVLMQKRISERLAEEHRKSIDTILPGSINPYDTLSILVYNERKQKQQNRILQKTITNIVTDETYNDINEPVTNISVPEQPGIPQIADNEPTGNVTPNAPLSEKESREAITEAADKDLAVAETISGIAQSNPPVAASKKSGQINRSAKSELLEIKPAFKGGETKLNSFLSENLNYPNEAIHSQTEGVVYVSFVVEKSGKINNIKVVKGIGNGCDEEAVRVVRIMPDWVAGQVNGKPVDERITLPIRFALNNKKP